jgi:xanthine dehydrogenase/oxidase
MKKIFISETSTDKVPNSSPTAASVSSDLNGMAVLNACLELKERLRPYKESNPKGSFGDWALSAYFDRVNLSANGFYKTPGLDHDWEKNTGKLYYYQYYFIILPHYYTTYLYYYESRYYYHTTGCAVSMVELDTLTGDHVILKTDIFMDIGNSINYSIDIGQIEGAFVQGLGWCTNEEVLVTVNNGGLLTRGPSNYKIPSARDIPVEFNVKILRDKSYKHLKTVKSSKGVGEPPLFLCSSVFFALKDAVAHAR